MWHQSLIIFALLSCGMFIEMNMANPTCPCEFIVHDSTSTRNPPAISRNEDDDSLEEYLNRYIHRYQPAASNNHLQDLSTVHALVRRSFLDENSRKRWKRPSWAPVGKRVHKRPSWAHVG